jgi:hypothetical protein
MYNMAASSDLLHSLKLNPQVTRMLDVYDETLRMWETQSINRIFKVTSQSKILARQPGVTICPMFDKLCISFGNVSTIVSPTTSTSAKRKALEIEDSAPDTPSPKRHHRDILSESASPRHHRDISPSPSALNPIFTRKFIQVPHGCAWPDGLLVHEVVHGFALMARVQGDQQTKFCTAFRGATWSKAKFARHQATWRSFSHKDSEEALRASNYMWKDLYRKRQR